MRNSVVAAFVAVLLTAVNGWTAPTVVLTLEDGSQYSVALAGIDQDNFEWTYRVTELEGAKDLSHWSIGPRCLLDKDAVVSTDPAGAEIGIDGSTGFEGIKWDVTDEFTSGLFTIQLDGVYPLGQIPVQVKAGRYSEIGYIDGPVCPGTPTVPAPGTLLLGAIGSGLFGWLRRRGAIE